MNDLSVNSDKYYHWNSTLKCELIHIHTPTAREHWICTFDKY